MVMTQYLYGTFILASLAGVLLLNSRLRTGIIGTRLLRSGVVTVALFLCFDTIGAARGWFSSNPHLNSVIVSPGIPLEEPVLLFFLTVLSISLWWAARRVME
jgi:lycopene cyclase domain-containing protein